MDLTADAAPAGWNSGAVLLQRILGLVAADGVQWVPDGALHLFRPRRRARSKVLRPDAFHPDAKTIVLIQDPLDRPVVGGDGDDRCA